MFEVYGGNTVCGATVSGYGLSKGYLDYRALAEIVGNRILNMEIRKVEELEISASDWLKGLIDYYKALDKFLRANRVRRHKKKRTDKKWEKRYGYKTDVTRFKDL